MGETMVRGDFLVHRGVPVIDDTLDLCPGNVGGQIIAIPFTYQAATTISGTEMKLAGSTCTKFHVPKAGSIVGASIYANTAIAGGHCTFTAYIGSTASAAILFNMNTVAGETRSDYVWQNKDTDVFAAGDDLVVKMTSDTLTTSTVGLTLFVEM